jgi:predicted P-loop ATPase
VRCRREIDLKGLRRDRLQIWAEALAKYRAGMTWWLDDAAIVKAAQEEQQDRCVDDPLRMRILEHAEAEAALPISAPRWSASIPEILTRLGYEVSKQDHAAEVRVSRVLKMAKWERFKKRISATSFEWRYRKVKE